MLVGHVVHVWVVWILICPSCFIFRLFYRSLEESLFFSFGLRGACTCVQGHHYHLAFLHTVLHLAKVDSHLHLCHDSILRVPCPSALSSPLPVPTTLSHAQGHSPCLGQIIVSIPGTSGTYHFSVFIAPVSICSCCVVGVVVLVLIILSFGRRETFL